MLFQWDYYKQKLLFYSLQYFLLFYFTTDLVINVFSFAFFFMCLMIKYNSFIINANIVSQMLMYNEYFHVDKRRFFLCIFFLHCNISNIIKQQCMILVI
jgi:hypothetical protein